MLDPFNGFFIARAMASLALFQSFENEKYIEEQNI